MPRTTSWRTVRVFISSTFRDMHAERDHLVKVVFPALRERLEKYRIHLVDIDLRWGITEEEAQHDRVLDLCLQQIDECRPFFVGILGERYGWVPKAFSEGAASKYGWVQYHTGKSVTELEIVHGVLHDPKMQNRGLFFFRDPAFIADLPEANRADFAAEDAESAQKLAELKDTIRHAPLPHPPIENYPCRYAGLRLNWRLARQELSEADQQALEAIASDGVVDPEEFARLDERLQGIVLRYGVVHLTGLEAFGRAVGSQLWEAIKTAEDLPEAPPVEAEAKLDPLAEEQDYHERFMESRLRVYVGRQEVQDHLIAFADGDATVPCLVTGPSGSGKSAAVARFARWVAENRPDVLLVPHFVGASPGSTSLRQMLRRFCLILKDRFALADEVPLEASQLAGKFREFVGAVPADSRVVFVIDALNQLDESDYAHSLYWLPGQFPPQVKIVVSCIDEGTAPVGGAKGTVGGVSSPRDTVGGASLPRETVGGTSPSRVEQSEILQSLARRNVERLRIQPLTGGERLEIVSQVPLLSAKKLDPKQIGLLLSNPATDNPLFLLVALEELRGFGSYEQLAARIAAFPREGDTVTAIFGQVIERLREEFDADTVRTVLALLACSRNGMAERELLEMIEGPGVEESAGDLFPVLRQLRPYLQHRGELIDFFHRGLYKAVRSRYLPDDESPRPYHHDLAEYFRKKADPAGDGTWSGQYIRGWSELAFHMFHEGRTAELRQLLMTFLWIHGRLRATDVHSLIGDYDLLNPGRKEPLGLVQGALQLSSHVLATDKAQLAPQLLGRMLGEPDPPIVALLDQAKQWRGAPWLRPLHPCLTAPGGPLLRTLAGHTKSVNAVSVFDDGRRAISASRDNTLKVWDLATGREIRTLQGHTSYVNAVSVFDDGRRAVSASNDTTLKVWDLATGREIRTLEGHTNWVNAVSVFDDGRRAISASWDRTLKVWDLATGRVVRTLEGHTQWVSAVSVFDDGRRAISASYDHTLKVWDLATGREIRTLEGHTSVVNAVSVFDDGRRAISASGDHTLKVWDLATGREIRTLEGHTDMVNAVSVFDEGRRAISASHDKTLKVWDLATGREIRTLEGHTNSVTAVSVFDDGRRAISASWDNTLKVWDLATGTALRTLNGHAASVTAVSVFADGRRAISASRDKTLKVWDLATGSEVRTLEGHTSFVGAVSVFDDGRRAVSASWDRTLKVWDLATGREIRTLKGHRDSVNAVSVFHDGRRAISASDDNTLKVWDLTTGCEIRTLQGHTNSVRAVAVFDDGRRAVSASGDNTLKVWDLATGAAVARFTGEGEMTACAVAPDRVTIVAGDSLGRVYFLRLEGG